MRRFWIALPFILLLVAACGPNTGTSTPVLTASPTTQTATAEPTPTPTPVPGAVVLVAPQSESDPIVGVLESELEARAGEAGLRFERILPETTMQDMPEPIELAVVFRPDQQLIDHLRSVGIESDQVVAVAPSESISADGMVTIGVNGIRADQAAFLAGYTAAVLSDNYRVAIVSVQGVSPEGAERSFIAGARYYCGLCRAAYPPFADYPASIRLESTAETSGTAAVIQRLQDLAIRSVYLAPGLERGPLGAAIAEADMNLLAQQRPAEFPEERWLAAIRPAPEIAFADHWDALLEGQAPAQIEMPLTVTDRNSQNFTDARYRLVEEVLEDLVAGNIGTGVDLP